MSRHNRRMGPLSPFAAHQMNGGANLAMPSAVERQIMEAQQRVANVLNRRDNIMAGCIAAAFGNRGPYEGLVESAKAIAEEVCVAQMLVASTQFFRDQEKAMMDEYEAQLAAQAEQNRVIHPDDDAAE